MNFSHACRSKVRHPARADAIQAIASLVRQRAARPGEMRCYPCLNCLGWHVGHENGGPAELARKRLLLRVVDSAA